MKRSLDQRRLRASSMRSAGIETECVSQIEKGRGAESTYCFTLVDLWGCHIQPTRTHDLAIYDETFEGSSGGTEDVRVKFSRRFDRNIGFSRFASFRCYSQESLSERYRQR